MRLFFLATNNEINFDLLDLLKILKDVFKTDDFEFELFDYEYNGVNFDWRNINQNIINFLEEENKDIKLIINYTDFLKFAEFINQTEKGSFKVVLPARNISLEVNVYDSYFWNISSNNEKALFRLSDHNKLISFKRRIEVAE